MMSGLDTSSEHSSIILGLEEKLSSSFKPVTPNDDFVKRLKKRLAATPALRLEDDTSSGILAGAVGIVLVFTGLLFARWLWKYLFPDGKSD